LARSSDHNTVPRLGGGVAAGLDVLCQLAAESCGGESKRILATHLGREPRHLGVEGSDGTP
jgi:hypothetical protein